MISKKYLDKILSYDESTGVIRSLVSRGKIKAGQEVGTIRRSNGYRQICINRKLFYAHRVALIMSGFDVDGCHVDHINGVKDDNRLSNLRVCRNFENIQNIKKPYKTNKLNCLGVSRANQSFGYTARISSKGSVIHIGTFQTIESAHSAYINKKRDLHEFNTL